MKFKFNKNLDYQIEAIESIVNIFDTGVNTFGTETIIDTNENALFENIKVVRNVLEIDEGIEKRVELIQKENKISLDSRLRGNDKEKRGDNETGWGYGEWSDGREWSDEHAGLRGKKPSYDFSVEMETGTGKTYVYIRTMFELNKKYGLKKFIILVPSVAIREGVLKTLQQTKEHFKEIYSVGYGYFGYDSKKLSKVREFAQSLDIQIMVMTIQAFNKDTNIMRQTPDRFYSESPIDLVAQTSPVVIMDEPQNMESELSKSAIKDLKPLFKLRYSATHKEKHNLMYVLSPVDAYRDGLVKKIEVYGTVAKDPGAFAFNVKDIKTQKGMAPRAEVGVEIKNANGDYIIKNMTLKHGDDLRVKTKNDKYAGIYINEINASLGTVELSDGKIYKLAEEIDENKEAIFRAQIRETVKSHFQKQQDLGNEIKVLSLFFIDKVENYMGQEGIIRKIFEEEYEKLKVNYGHFKDVAVEKVHNGYFACSKVKGEDVYKDTTGKTLADKEAYDLIMKDKEKLLSFSEPTCFIFSHSALKEGWDNPNIFQICTLNETKSGAKKRQEIGRGLRLCVDVEGNRVYDPKINVLTVVANESYMDFVASLQSEYDAAEYREAPKTSDARGKTKAKFRFKKGISAESEEFNKLWDKIKKKTKFNIEIKSDELIKNVVGEIDKLEIDNLIVRVEKVMLAVEDKGGKFKTIYENESAGGRLKSSVRIGNVLDRIVRETGITKRTAYTILSGVSNLDLIFDNPEEYLRSIVVIINAEKEKLLINEGLQYLPVNDAWEITLFEDIDTYKGKSVECEKSAYDRVIYDSDGEREFAKSLDERPDIKLFVKLPPRFVVDTPLGTYNPDWAIVTESEEGHKVYLVRETKFGVPWENLRLSERQKIVCGEKHFTAIGVDFKTSYEKDLSDLR